MLHLQLSKNDNEGKKYESQGQIKTQFIKLKCFSYVSIYDYFFHVVQNGFPLQNEIFLKGFMG